MGIMLKTRTCGAIPFWATNFFRFLGTALFPLRSILELG
jgi:hypothetical protein